MNLKKIGKIILDIVELYIPMLAFAVLFLTFIYATCMRYLFNRPVGWAIDVELGCYIWLVLFSASYVMRIDKHVRFTIVYDLLNDKVKWLFRLVSNLMIIIPFSLLLGPAAKYISNLRTISTALQLPLKFYYAPILWFICSVIIYAARDLIKDLMLLRKPCRSETRTIGEEEGK